MRFAEIITRYDMTLKKIDDGRRSFYIDENNRKQGEYKDYWENGNRWWHCFYLDSSKHGEFKSWSRQSGELEKHCFYDRGRVIHELPVSKLTQLRLTKRYGHNVWICKPPKTCKNR